METYISINGQCKPETRTALLSFFRAAESGDRDGLVSAGNSLGSDAAASIEALLASPVFTDYLEGLSASSSNARIDANAICGSSGLEFLIALINAVGPSCDEVTGTYAHDEDPPDEGEWPLKLAYKDGRVLVNGTLYSSYTGMDEKDEIDEEPRFEAVGPLLGEAELGPLRSVCRTRIEADGSTLKDYLATFEEVCEILTGLERAHRSEAELDEELAEEFRELYRAHGAFLEQSNVNEYLCAYYKSALAGIAEESNLGTCVNRFTEPFYFSSALIGLIEDGEVREMFEESIHSQEDFDGWKDFVVMMAENYEE